MSRGGAFAPQGGHNMKKLLFMLLAAAILAPGMAVAQYYYTYPRYETPSLSRVDSQTIRQDRIRIASARQTLAVSQAVLDRDQSMGRWWKISDDVARVNRDRLHLRRALDSYYQDRSIYQSGRTTSPFVYRYYTPY
jgi:hypothetical protein